jgi:hypothetical protein
MLNLLLMTIDPKLFNLLQLKYALRLEIQGIKHSRGSVYAHVKRRFGFRGNKQRVLIQLEEHIDENK